MEQSRRERGKGRNIINKMVKNLAISIFLLTFAIGIVGSHDPMTRELSTSPFPINKVDGTKKLSNMTKKKDLNNLKREFNEKWGALYDYSQILDYKNNKQKLPIVCVKHGVFLMSANDHLRGRGCPKCAREITGQKCRMTLKEFLRRAQIVHGNKYDYSLLTEETFVGGHSPVDIICAKHGIYKQSPKDHLSGRGCYWCGKESMANTQALTRNDVVNRCKIIFDNKYDYRLFDKYHNKNDRIKVICPIHGVWEVSVNNHLYRHSGCPRCKRSIGEEKIANFLNNNKIDFIEQYKIKNEFLFCENTTIMIDFYLPKINVAIEYNGAQHYKPIPIFHSRSFESQQWRDNSVKSYCQTHKIKLIIIPYTEDKNIESILRKELKLTKYE